MIRWSVVALKAAYLTLLLFASMWLLILAVHIFVPSSIIFRLFGNTVAVEQDAYFYPVDRLLGLNQGADGSSQYASVANVFYWTQNCLGPAIEKPPQTNTAGSIDNQNENSELNSPAVNGMSFGGGSTGSSTAIAGFGEASSGGGGSVNTPTPNMYKDPKIERISETMSGLAASVNGQLWTSKLELYALKTRSNQFALALIVLGALTTIVSAINSFEWSKATTGRAFTIRVLAIVLPALVTAMTAVAAIYASSDQVNRKAQLVYNLISLGADINAAVSSSECPITSTAPIEQNLVDWSRRLSAMIASAEFAQSPQSNDNKPGNDKPDSTKQDDSKGKDSIGPAAKPAAPIMPPVVNP